MAFGVAFCQVDVIDPLRFAKGVKRIEVNLDNPFWRALSGGVMQAVGASTGSKNADLSLTRLVRHGQLMQLHDFVPLPFSDAVPEHLGGGRNRFEGMQCYAFWAKAFWGKRV
jgi:hypothetical protein